MEKSDFYDRSALERQAFFLELRRVFLLRDGVPSQKRENKKKMLPLVPTGLRRDESKHLIHLV
jgi:hypothetical protein